MYTGNREEKGRPVTIKDEGLTLVNNVTSLDFQGAGVVGSFIGDNVTETIPGSSPSELWHTGTPSGIMDGINVNFSLPGEPITNSLDLFLNGQRLTEMEDYSISGVNISMNIPPLEGSVFTYKYQA